MTDALGMEIRRSEDQCEGGLVGGGALSGRYCLGTWNVFRNGGVSIYCSVASTLHQAAEYH
jgi:hypothetical protein